MACTGDIGTRVEHVTDTEVGVVVILGNDNILGAQIQITVVNQRTNLARLRGTREIDGSSAINVEARPHAHVHTARERQRAKRRVDRAIAGNTVARGRGDGAVAEARNVAITGEGRRLESAVVDLKQARIDEIAAAARGVKRTALLQT